jgi:hypothetical protein
MGLRTTLEHLDRRWIFLVMGLAVLLPLFVRVGLPIFPSPFVKQFYRTIEELPEGSVVYLATDFDPGSMPELYPMLEASLRHCFRRNLKVIAGSLWPACPPLTDKAFRDVGEGEYHAVEGRDFVNLGFKEGRQAVMVRLGKSIPGTYPLDAKGRSVETIPIMKGIRNFDQCALIINISAGYPGTKEWVQQVRTRFDIPLVAGVTAVSAPEFYPYVQSGQLQGLLGGLAGAAEYEVLLDHEGTATRGMDAQSLGHVVIVFFIVLGNLLFIGRRRGSAT